MSTLVILIIVLYILSDPTFIIQVSATPSPQVNSPSMFQGVTAASTSINWWPYSQVSVSAASTIPTYTAANPIPLISLAASTSSKPGAFISTTPTLLSSPIISTPLYTAGTSFNSQVSSQTTGSSTAAPSTATPNMTSQEPAGGQAGQINFLYFIPVGIVLSAMFGASVAVVLTRRCRQGIGDSYPHPFPEEGGISRFNDMRDEQERRWIENRQTYSEDEYETDSSNGAFSSQPTQLHRVPGRARLDSSDFSLDHEDMPGYAVPRTHVPISESFYDETLAESKALELNLSSDEDPPVPYAHLRGESIRRVLLPNINRERNRRSGEHESSTAPLRIRQKAVSQSTRSSGVAPVETRSFCISPPVQHVLSPRQIQELFFIDHADLSRNQWVTAEKLLAGDEDSDEEDAIKGAILHAGINRRIEHSRDYVPLVKTTGTPTSISALSTAVASRRLVKPILKGSTGPMQVLTMQEHREDGKGESSSRNRPSGHLPRAAHGYGASTVPVDALCRVADIISTSWSQRDVTSLDMSITGFES